MATMQFEAEPYPLEFDPESTALLIIDMQRDFVEPGGFGEMLGNDVSLLRSTIEPCQRVLEAARQRRADRDPHARGPPARPGRRAALQAPARRARGRHRRQGPDGPRPGARRARPRHHPGALSARRRAGDRQAGQGLVLRDRPRPDPAEPRHQDADRVRRDHRGVRAHHGARGERPRLRMRRAVRLRRLVFPGVPAGRASR